MAEVGTISYSQDELDAFLAKQRAAAEAAQQRNKLPTLGSKIDGGMTATGKTYSFDDGTQAASFTDASGKTVMMPVQGTQPSNIPSQQDINKFTSTSDMLTSGLLGFARGASKAANFASFGYIPTLEERIAKERNIPIEAVTKLLEGGIQANPVTGKVSEFGGEALPAVAAGGVGGGLLRLGAAGLRTAIPAAAEALGARTVMAPILRGGLDTGLKRADLLRTAGNVAYEGLKQTPGAIATAARATWNSPVARYGAGLGAAIVGTEMTSMGRTPNYGAIEAQEAAASAPTNIVNLQNGGQAQLVTDENGKQQLVPIQPAAGMPPSQNTTGNVTAGGMAPLQTSGASGRSTADDVMSRFQSPVLEDRAEALARYYGIPYSLVLSEMKRTGTDGVTSALISKFQPAAPSAKDTPKVEEIAGRLALKLMDQKYQGFANIDPANLTPEQLKEYQAAQNQLMGELLSLRKVSPDTLSSLGLK